MKRTRGLLQKASLAGSALCFLLAVACLALLLLGAGGESLRDPVTASLAASTFFFACVGVVLAVIGRSDLPSFRFDPPHDER